MLRQVRSCFQSRVVEYWGKACGEQTTTFGPTLRGLFFPCKVRHLLFHAPFTLAITTIQVPCIIDRSALGKGQASDTRIQIHTLLCFPLLSLTYEVEEILNTDV